MSQEKIAPGTSSEDLTLPPPRTEAPATKGVPQDATLASAPPATVPVPGALPGGTTAGLHADATLPPPPRDPSGDITLAQTQAPAFAPTDATLNPDDPQVKEFHKTAQDGAKGPAITTGASFGHYELIAPIAKGGMGIVYKARQRNLNRIVAIKMILAGQFADQTDVDRFYAEAEAAAALRHSNIVAIHEIGEVQGQHFFSMDYIDGQSLAALVQESPLPPRRAAELLITISETMQFAHDSGIIHRDLKPSNILLDKKQRPLITDFGLAKQVTNQSQITIAGAVVGTPSYMPPEQASGKGDQVGPWSDLYSLGAILYECLTGRPPFRAATPFETIRQVLETEPVSPRLVNPGLPRDIETICLKCLQKESSKRYASAQELADELGRFIRGEPIRARPISQAARFWRLCKRYPVTAAAIAAAILMLVTAAAGFGVGYVKEAQARAIADQSLRDQMSVVNDLFTRVSEDTLLNQSGMQPLRRDLLQKAKDYYEKFLKQRGNDPRVQDELGVAYFRMGAIVHDLESPTAALVSYRKAREIQQRLLGLRPNDPPRLEALGNTLNALGVVWVKTKDFDAARKDYGEALRIRAKLAATDPANSEYQWAWASTSMNIGMAEYKAKQLPQARKYFEEAQRIRTSALERSANHANLRRDLAMGYYNLANLDIAEGGSAGGPDHAERHLKSAISVLEKLTSAPPQVLDNERLLAICYRLLGDILSDERTAERRQYYQKALGRLEPLALENPAVVDYQMDRAGLLLNLFDLELTEGNTAEARAAIEGARDIYAALAKRFPDDGWCLRDLAVALRELAKVQDAAGEGQTAADNLKRAIEILDGLVSGNPQEAEYADALEATKAVMLGGGKKSEATADP